MTSRARVLAALNHREPDRVPIDFGSTAVTGIHVSCVAALRAPLRPGAASGEGPRTVPDAGLDRRDLAAAMGARHRRGLPAQDHVRLPQRGWKPWRIPRPRRPGAGELQRHPRRERRHSHLSRRRPVRAAQRPHAKGRLLLRHHRPPAADRRGPPDPGTISRSSSRSPKTTWTTSTGDARRGVHRARRDRQLRRHRLRRHRAGARPRS